jgi:hypothetical protein
MNISLSIILVVKAEYLNFTSCQNFQKKDIRHTFKKNNKFKPTMSMNTKMINDFILYNFYRNSHE